MIDVAAGGTYIYLTKRNNLGVLAFKAGFVYYPGDTFIIFITFYQRSLYS